MTDQAFRAAPHNSPRTWFLTSALSPLAVRLIRELLAHGDQVVACLPPQEIEDEDRGEDFEDLVEECKSDERSREGWKDRLRAIRCDGKIIGNCDAAIAESVKTFGSIDILLCCRSESMIGTLEEFVGSTATQNLVREQFDTNFFSHVNLIKAALPQLRAQQAGHIIALTSTGGEIGTPGMAMYTAATWAMEGYCDSLAYEVAPFNIRVTVLRPNQEIQMLTNKLTFAPQMAAYDTKSNPAPSIRDMLTNVLNSNPATALSDAPLESSSSSNPPTPTATRSSVPALDPEPGRGKTITRYVRLPQNSLDELVAETIHAIAAIGGHENPPSRHIIGWDGAMAVKEKHKTMLEEMDNFIDASLAVDTFESELKEEARQGRRKGEEHESLDS